MNISFRSLEDTEEEYLQLYKWCKDKHVYEWFEQKALSLEEITNKYKAKLEQQKQKLYIIQCDNKDIGLIQIYKFENDINIEELSKYDNIYEYDMFIGEKDYLSKGIGKKIIGLINHTIYMKFEADAIILRPFKRNIRAIKCYEKCDFKVISEYKDTDTLGKPETVVVLLNKKSIN